MLLAIVSLIIQLIVIHRIITHGGPVQCKHINKKSLLP
jgi:hypothetical protein